jgi:hypothetical protein
MAPQVTLLAFILQQVIHSNLVILLFIQTAEELRSLV